MGTVHRLIKFFEDGAQTDPTPAVHSSSGSMGGGAAAAATRPLAPINENREGVDNLAFKAPSGGADAGGSKESVSLDDFRLLAVIGRGGYGKVVQAEHLQTKQIYAIKIIKKSLQFEGDDDFDWVLTEKSVFKVASDYPFLVGLHSCFQTNSRLFFVMAFVPGGDLFHHMEQQKKLPEEHARFYSAEIILALDYLHSRGIIYRDLKPDNVLIDAEGHFKLTDYGMCKENMGPNDLTSSPFGTPNYMTPELLQSYDYSFSVDWWALGVLMFEMMAGRKPFEVVSVEGEDEVMETARLFASIRDNPIRLPRSLSVPARAVLGDFLNKDPSERLGCKKDIDEGLRDIMAHTFFRGHIDWEALEAKQVEPPYIPCLDGDRDLKHFDTQYTNEDPSLSFVDPEVIARIDQSKFDGFEYVNPLLMSREDSV